MEEALRAEEQGLLNKEWLQEKSALLIVSMALGKLCHKWRAAAHKAVQVRITSHAAESIACLLVAYELEISCPIGASVHNNIVQYILQRTASGSGNPGLPVLRPVEEALRAEEQGLLNKE